MNNCETCEPMCFEHFVPYAIKVIRNDSTNNIQLQLKDPYFEEGLTGASIKMQIKDETTGAVKKELSTDSGGILIQDEAEGIFDILPYLCDLTVKQYNYDIQITYNNGMVKTRFKGKYTVLNDITQ
jgi:hypothetical protein